ncbi:MAG: hypothetical protein B6I29_00320, partial [Marinitoga sp. 4572_148]
MREVFIVKSIEKKKINLISTRSSSCESCELNGACNLTGSNDERVLGVDLEQFNKKIPQFLAFLLISYFITKNDMQAFLFGLIGLGGAYGVIAYLDRTV